MCVWAGDAPEIAVGGHCSVEPVARKNVDEGVAVLEPQLLKKEARLQVCTAALLQQLRRARALLLLQEVLQQDGRCAVGAQRRGLREGARHHVREQMQLQLAVEGAAPLQIFHRAAAAAAGMEVCCALQRVVRPLEEVLEEALGDRVAALRVGRREGG